MQRSDYNELLKTGLRRKLTADEELRLQAYFRVDPGAQAEWEEEMSLNHLLRRLPDAPLASNFTSQVLQLVERDGNQSSRAQGPWLWRPLRSFNWIRRTAVASLVLGLTGFSVYQYQRSARREVAESVVEVSKSLPTIEMLENFEAIRRLDQVPQKVDVELLAALR